MYQSALEGSPGLNLVPAQWLHLTIQGVTWADEISETEIDLVAEKVRLRLAEIPMFDLHFSKAAIIKEAIILPPTPVEPLHGIWQEIRNGIADALGGSAVSTAGEQSAGFRPHVSIAYVNTAGPSAPYREILSKVKAEPIAIPVERISLILQERVLAPEWVYRWTTRAEAGLGQP
ncbi:2'-5' RNA ligase family protein [Nonomuraea jabiensis]|uniref:2'-5' RNA ligase family protein n=1 Tax=Nonomuraea jabiensis TaxID=882448 RepID=UPI003D75D6C6